MDYIERYNLWLSDDYFDDETKKELEAIRANDAEIEDRFHSDLEFGTAGLRGKIGAGTNRMNQYTVSLATQGLATTIISYGKEAMEKGVVIGYDVRHYSREFSEIAARVLAANGIKAYLFDDIRPTPLVSFAIRELKTISGIMVTASHNPKDYNGYKVYWDQGSQILDDKGDEILGNIQALDTYSQVKLMDFQEGLDKGLIKIIGCQIDDIYIDKIKETSISEEIDKDIRIVYSPLNGTGNKLVRRILKERGFKNVFVVPDQEKPDPNFETVGYPNPEDVKAFDYSKKFGREKDASILIATDPDCDRVAAMVRDDDGQYVFINGNQMGALLVEYILSQRSKLNNLPANGVIVKSIVTGDLSRAIADKYNIETLETLTGFKYICETANEFDITKEKVFIFGYEESIGYVYDTIVRDKDGVISSMFIAEMAAYYKKHGKSLLDKLHELYEEYGYYNEKLISIVIEGITGQARIGRIVESLRENPIKDIDGFTFKDKIDYLYDETGNPKTNALKVIFEDKSWFAIRPSGTEPKFKAYIYVIGNSLEDSKEKIARIENAIMERVDSIE